MEIDFDNIETEDYYRLGQTFLIERLLILEKKYHNRPIKFCFNGHFYAWKDIKTIVSFIENKGNIKLIQVITNLAEYKINSLKKLLYIKDIEDQFLRFFKLEVREPYLDLEMDSDRVFIYTFLEDPKVKQLTDYLSIFLNKGCVKKGWYVSGNCCSLQHPDVDK
jgi:hypothetical protein